MSGDPSLRAGLEHLMAKWRLRAATVSKSPYLDCAAAVADLLRAQPPDLAQNEQAWKDVAADGGIHPEVVSVTDVLLLRRAVGNCYMMAKREIARHLNQPLNDPKGLERWQHVLRFCETTGEKSSILRGQLPTELTEGEEAGRAQPPDLTEEEDAKVTDGEAVNLRYARGLLRKAASVGASFVDINADVLRYLVESRRRLNDRLRWAEQRAQPPPATDPRERAQALNYALALMRNRIAVEAPQHAAIIQRHIVVLIEWLASPPAVEPPPAPDPPKEDMCVCGHEKDQHGNDGEGACGATKACRAGGCKQFTLASPPAVEPPPAPDPPPED